MYLLTDGPRHGNGEGPDVAAAQVLPFPLVTEELELPLLLVIQAVAVADLGVVDTRKPQKTTL